MDTRDPNLEHAMSAILFGLGNPCWNLKLRDDGVLMLNCFVCDSATRFQSRSVEHAIHLNRFVGNNNGSFDVNDSGFMASARNARLRGTLLCAELRTVRGEWKEAEIQLDSIIRVDGCFGARKPNSSYRFDVRLREEVPNAAAFHSPAGANEMRQAIDGPHLLYPPLDALEDSYRICYIEPGQWDDPICCTTATWRAKDEQRYPCLSYVCGDQNHTIEIRLNSHAKCVTHNLFVAMRRLRWHGVRAIWIDALCINQDDNEEKGKQVSRMSATYANAFRVIIWLGSFPLNADDLEDHVGALEESMFAAFLRRLVSGAHIPDAVEDARNVTENAGQPHDVRQTALRLQRVCYRLSRSGWFSRTWTVQEHIMARQSVFAFGDEVIDAKAAFYAIDLARSHIVVQKRCSDSTSAHNIKVFMDRFVEFMAAFEWLVCVGENSDEARRHLDSEDSSAAVRALVLLVHGRRRSCLDPRDKIFAFLGVTYGALGALEADYSISVAELYTKVTWSARNRMGSLDIWLLFMYGTGTSRHRLEGLPSWAVDWDAQPDPSGYTFSDKDFANAHLLYPMDYRSASPKQSMVCLDPTGNILAVWGTEFGVIRRITQPDWPSRHDVTARDGNILVVSRLRYWLKFLGLEDTEQISANPLLWEKFWTLVSSRTSTTSVTPSAADIKNLQARICLHNDAANESSRSTSPLELSPATLAVEAVVTGRELFVTNDGRIGLCPATALVGDTLFHVVGSRLPVLLRPCPPASGTCTQSTMYTLVGICFASDLTYEIVQEAFSQAEEIRIR